MKSKLLSFYLFAMTLGLTSKSMATEELLNSGKLLENEGAYQHVVTDQQWGDIAFSRTYYSRTLFKGIFGWGWCSFLDLKVENNFVYDCWSDQKVPVSLNSKDLSYEWKTQNTTYRFNTMGELIAVTTPKHTVIIERNTEGTPIAFNHNQQKTLIQAHWSLTKNLRILAIGKVQYTYNQQQLTRVVGFKQVPKTNITYHYDDFENLVKIENGNNKIELITYDSPNDLALKVAVLQVNYLK